MIKKLLIILITMFLLCGCNNNRVLDFHDELLALGYDDNTALIIESLNEEHQALFKESLNDELVKIISDQDFIETNLEDYLKYDLKINDINYLINENLLNDSTYSKIKEYQNDNWYILKNTGKYLEYDNGDKDLRSLIEYVNAKAYKTPYEDYEMSDINKDTLMIASKIYSLGDYVPDDLVEVEDKYRVQGNNFLREVAYDAYKLMIADARSEGLDFYISTSYRSYDYQSYFYNMYLDQYGDQAYVDTFSARPGFSDHQTGLTCDIRQKVGDFETVRGTVEMEWLKNNSYKYGFILRYPEGKDEITGYEHEWWHFRYVGIEAAKIIYDNNLTFDEYYAYYVE